jgi:hypothetical protein
MTDTERELRRLAAMAQWPPSPGAAARAVRIIEQQSIARRATRRPALRRGAAALAMALVAGSGVAAASPGVRDAIGSVFGIGGVEVRRVPAEPPRSASDRLELGPRTSFREAQAASSFTLLRPPAVLGPPAGIHLLRGFPGGGVLVSFTYRARPGLPSARHGSVALVLSQFRAESLPYLDKTAAGATTVERLRVGGDPGAWLAGAPHQQVYRGPDGIIRPDTLRLATNTLVWERDGLTLRLEGAATKAQALRVAASVP